MPLAVQTELPASSLLAELQRRGSYTDCFSTTIPCVVSQAQFIEAFYTTAVFKSERVILELLTGRRSTDQEAAELAQGARDGFAVWRVAARRPTEILATDRTGRTSSWLMAVPANTAAANVTRLYFGSAITPRTVTQNGPPRFGPVFHALVGLHNLYSRKLLRAAAAKLEKVQARKA